MTFSRPAGSARPARVARPALSAAFRLFALFAVLAVASACGGDQANGSSAARAAQGTAAADTRQVIDLSRLGFNEGRVETAVVEVVEFSDFGCGYCRQFHEETFPSLREEFVESGQVVWKYIPILLAGFRNSAEVTLAAECAGAQDRFFEMRDTLFREQREWTRASDPQTLVDGYAEEMGLDMETFAACVEEGRPLDRMEMANRVARELGVRGTPTFFVSGQSVQGAVPLELFQQVLREQVESRTPSAPRDD